MRLSARIRSYASSLKSSIGDRWAALEPHVIEAGTVTEAANAAKAGGVDAAIVWDAVASRYADQAVLRLTSNTVGEVVNADEAPQILQGLLAWDGRDYSGRPVASGIYICKVTMGSEARTARVTMLR